jgi:UDP-3-O-[3-hydroxymyristoyl] glucosamine N-acyltransferase
MADPRFFKKTQSLTLGQIAELTGAALHSGAADGVIHDVGALDQAGQGMLSFLDNIKYKESFSKSRAAAAFVAPALVPLAPPGMALLVTETPYKAYAQAAQAFYPDSYPEPHISPAAHIDPTAKIGAGAIIEAGVVIQQGAEIGEGCWIEPNAVIGPGVVLGAGCRIGANATVSHTIIGRATRLYPGVRVGQDGFGFAIDPKGHVKVPQLGRVIIGDRVEIGANTCIDRGAGPDTEIGDGAWIDNLVQIGHNVKIGRGCVIVAQVGISGSTVIEDYAVLAGQVGVAGHLRIGRGARVAAQSGIMRDVAPGDEVMGSPALPIRQFMRQIAVLNKMSSRKKEDV